MKYCGITYNEFFPNKQYAHNDFTHDDAYEALKEANKKWNSIPDNNIGRLLVVILQNELNQDEETYAFFQFTDSNACELFVKKREKIAWSANDKKTWNGNAEFMT